MVGKLEGKVAFVTGAARGQGRSHALRLAQEGADIIAIDLLENMDTVPYDLGTETDLNETVRLVEALDRRIIASQADVRNSASLQTALSEGVAQLGKLDIVAANAGIVSGFAPIEELDDQTWKDLIDVDLSGVWYTAKAATPYLKANGGGSIICTSSVMGLKAAPNIAHYVAAKHGVVGLMKALAIELAPFKIRVNTIHPTTVATDMTFNDPTYRVFRPDLENPTKEDFMEAAQRLNPFPVALIDAVDLSNALVFLASDEARYVTGITMPIDAGFLLA
jgi:(+)-trans-carveol dehydrogenase